MSYCLQVLLELEKYPTLLESCADVVSVLKTLGLRFVNEQREGLALKLHYLSYFIQLACDHGNDAILKR